MPQDCIRLAYSAREVADLLGVSERTVWARIADGTIQVVRIGGTTRVPALVLERLVGAPDADSDSSAEEEAPE